MLLRLLECMECPCHCYLGSKTHFPFLLLPPVCFDKCSARQREREERGNEPSSYLLKGPSLPPSSDGGGGGGGQFCSPFAAGEMCEIDCSCQERRRRERGGGRGPRT